MVIRHKPKIYGDDVFSSKAQENRIASDLGGRVQKASGALPGNKGDIDLRDGGFLIEAKGTQAQSIRIRQKWLNKISKEAFESGLIPALTFEIEGGRDPHTPRDWIAIPVVVFHKMLSCFAENND